MLGRGDHVLGAAVQARDHQQHRCIQVGCDADVEIQFGGGGQPVVVGADHDHGGIAILQGAVLLDDLGQRHLGIGHRLGGQQANHFIVGLIDTAMGEQGVGHLIVVVADDGTEDADRFHLAAEGLNQPQRDSRFTDRSFRGGNVNTLVGHHSKIRRFGRPRPGTGRIARWPAGRDRCRAADEPAISSRSPAGSGCPHRARVRRSGPPAAPRPAHRVRGPAAATGWAPR